MVITGYNNNEIFDMSDNGWSRRLLVFIFRRLKPSVIGFYLPTT